MRLDNTQIAIRERGVRELFDLALVVVRRWVGPLLAALICGGLPFATLNHLLLRGLIYDALLEEGWGSYVTCMTVLVFLEAPLATALVTAYLGQAMFAERPSLVQAARDLRPRLGQLLWYGLVVRFLLPVWWLVAVGIEPIDPEGGIALLVMLTFCLGMVRGLRPFLFEVILLERNPWRNPSGGLTTARRSAALHQPSGGELFGHFVLAMIIGSAMAVGLWLTLWYFRAHLTNEVEFAETMFVYMLPVAMWLVAGYMSVVRFLSYLDLRIRHEGWEVELRMRAEGAQLARGRESFSG
jgi:hypothetical protein